MFYADPGSGLLVWQLMLALFLGATFYVIKLRSWIASKLKSESGNSVSADGTSSKRKSE